MNFYRLRLILNGRWYLLADSMYTSLNLGPGVHRYPFRLRLPADLPASYRGSHGYVRYKARATVEGPSKGTNQICVESEFLVCRSVDLNREPAKLRVGRRNCSYTVGEMDG